MEKYAPIESKLELMSRQSMKFGGEVWVRGMPLLGWLSYSVTSRCGSLKGSGRSNT